MTRSDLYDVAVEDNGNMLSADKWDGTDLFQVYLDVGEEDCKDALFDFADMVERTAFLVGFEAAVSLFTGHGVHLTGLAGESRLKDGAMLAEKEDRKECPITEHAPSAARTSIRVKRATARK